jgi:hypothetical protein
VAPEGKAAHIQERLTINQLCSELGLTLRTCYTRELLECFLLLKPSALDDPSCLDRGVRDAEICIARFREFGCSC